MKTYLVFLFVLTVLSSLLFFLSVNFPNRLEYSDVADLASSPLVFLNMYKVGSHPSPVLLNDSPGDKWSCSALFLDTS